MTDENRPSRKIQQIQDRDGTVKAYVVTTPAHGSRRAAVAVFYRRHLRFSQLEASYARQQERELGT